MRYVTASILLMFGAFVNCGREQSPEPLTPAAATAPGVSNAVEGIASARCDREQSCGHVGATQKYASRNHCMSVMRADAKDSLSDCRQGIDSKDLDQCLVDIRNEDCGSVLDKLERWKSCHADDLCLH